MKARIIGIMSILFIGWGGLDAQYFGQNKPNYEKFKFEVYQTPHFDIHYYLQNKEVLRDLANASEHWYQMHQNVLEDTIRTKNPILFYNDHADFQQTNAISGSIGVGTGGVTEAFKNRVILPLAMSNEQTHHVLGHELVHAFQYNMILQGDSTNIQNLGNLPLWMVEGLAEYMSVGRVDPHTAMWMRDAVLNDDVPELKKMNDYSKYFPYRYGQVFWAFLTGWKGDDIIEPFFVATAKYGLDRASLIVLGIKEKDLSKLWVDAVKEHFGQYVGDRKEKPAGKELIDEKNGGRMNIAPEISPNGRYVIFLSERDVFTTDLFLADVRTGKILSKVASTLKDGHIDDFNYIESSGTWSPDSRQFAFVGVSQGDNVLIIKEVESGKTIRESRLKGVPAFSNPAWSPDGRTIVVSGLVEGQTDLFSYDVKSGKVTRLTNDRYSEIHPTWSDDGKTLIFSTDELSLRNGRINGRWNFNLAMMDIVSGQVEHLDVFPGAFNLNPEEDSEGNIIFLSDRDGFRNLYKYEPATGRVYQLTKLLTGVSGITPYAPAISIDRKRNRLLYTYFTKNRYRIYSAQPEDFLQEEVDPKAVDLTPAELPRLNKRAPDIVEAQLNLQDQLPELPDSAFTEKNYRARFKLDYIGGSAGVGVGGNATFGTTTGIAGGVDMLFSDMLGNNQLFSSLALNGEITDFGGAVAYINRQSRLNWGISLSHIPYRSLFLGDSGLEDIPVNGGSLLAVADTFYMQRIFEEQLGVFASYPFSTTLRVQGQASFAHYSSRVDQYVYYYSAYPVGGGLYARGNYLGQDREKVDNGNPFNLMTLGAALVGDNSSFGLTAPMTGHRFRLGLDQYFGAFEFTALTADYRVYRFFKPVGVAFRAMHYGRYGGNSDLLFPLYVGSPWFIRGLNSSRAQEIFAKNDRSFDELVGTKMFISNFEFRIPFTGPEQLSLFKSGFLFTDLNFFVDGGVAWTDFDQFDGDILRLDVNGKPIINPETNEAVVLYPKARPVFTAGVSLRFNVFGAFVLEPYYAFPLMKNTMGGFGLNIVPGW